MKGEEGKKGLVSTDQNEASANIVKDEDVSRVEEGF